MQVVIIGALIYALPKLGGIMRRMQFFGVRTAGSLAFRLFPHWARVLRLEDVVLEGVDLPLGHDLEPHRSAVHALKADADVQGALITSHKLSVMRAADDLIDLLTPPARLCHEVSALYKRGGVLWGDACDPANSGQALNHFLGPDYWRQHPEGAILSLGGGGATVAMLLYLLTEASWRPRQLIITDIRPDNLAHCAKVASSADAGRMQILYALSGTSTDNDAQVAALPPYSLVINATGMGKDVPGSPITDAAVFPEKGAVWELNYRGERYFLQQAHAQRASRDLQVADGWHYFLHGWSSVMARVFDVSVSPATFTAFCAASEAHSHR